MNAGITYYPEYYDRSRWDGHFTKIRDLGLTRVRMAEFAWSLMQPDPDTFAWEIIDDAIDTAQRFGIEIVLGTPTACPPIWLVEQHPDVLPVNIEGRRTGFGARQHRCYNAPAYLEYSRRIVEAMAGRYGKHPNVVAWQIDNELGGEQKRCYCDHCRAAFQEFLKSKYGSVDELNRRWNNVFWSQHYQDWSQVPTPQRFAADLPMRHHPSLELEFSRFSSQSIVDYCNMQADILRRHTSRPITTNADTFYWGDNVDLFKLFANLDIGGMDIYSTAPHEIGFYSDFTRSVKPDDNRFWMMEYGTTSPKLCDEMEIARQRGCEWFMLFKFLPFPWGQEIDRKAFMTLTGEPGPNAGKVRDWIARERAAPAATRTDNQPPVGIYYDFDSSWAYWIDQRVITPTIPEQQLYPDYLINRVYKAAFEQNLPVQFLGSHETFSEYPLLILARQFMCDSALEEALIAYVRNGGHLLVTTDLFRRNRDNVYLEHVPGIYAELLNWPGKNFIEDNPEIGEAPVWENTLGSGRVRMLNTTATSETWNRQIAELL